jgi:hypothetical protein
MSVISYTCHRQKPFPDSSHKQCVPTSDICGIERILHRRGHQRTNLHSIDIRHQLHPYFLSPLHHLLTLRKHLTRSTAKLVVKLNFFLSTMGLICLLFHQKGVLFCCFPSDFTMFLA